MIMRSLRGKWAQITAWIWTTICVSYRPRLTATSSRIEWVQVRLQPLRFAPSCSKKGDYTRVVRFASSVQITMQPS